MIGFIGCGNMGAAIIKGMIQGGVEPNIIFAYDHNKNKIEDISAGINVCISEKDVVAKSKYIFIAVKPYAYDNVLHEIKDVLDDEKIIITMAAGYEIKRVEAVVGYKKIIRTMPNTPSLVGKGFIAVSYNEFVNDSEKQYFEGLLRNIGLIKVIKEDLMNAYSAVTGSGPAFVFNFMEAMADAAVLLGIPRKDAYAAVEMMILGSAELALKTERHPAELKDMVTSPGGTTIEGIRTLEEKSLRSAIIECIINTYKKNLDIKNIR
ncbi:Pyrroline-5-carboxylate reductase [Caloramator mitchellensis]|uniref:Pyrroline-5-carboxylate reductase n=1 Tax=Caloramator mitchellensis TaxID=908809 RepID=A0A0R3JU03_CALMK|nr:pyrroline-5-carboxylate reductase [Caloramator mitchellensis]KRQ87017.1 Pyrroline-5-carboxylate reductase [Caloramator mitchellensis]